MSKIFISYSSTDRPFAQQLRAELRAHGADVWIDVTEMRAGDTIIRTLSEAIYSTQYFIVILSPNSVASKWVREELEQALSRQIDADGKFVIPVLYQPCDIPSYLKSRKYLNLSSPDQFKNNFPSLLKSLNLLGENRHSALRNPEIRIEDDFLTKLRRDKSHEEAFREIFELIPSATLAATASKFQMFGGEFKHRLIPSLSFFSNCDDDRAEMAWALLFFLLSDIMSGTARPPPDGARLMASLASCMSIDTRHRHLAASMLVDLIKETEDREHALAVYPTIFPQHLHDPLADQLVDEFLAADEFDEAALLEKLWNVGSASHRTSIEAYVRHASSWRTPQLELALIQTEQSLRNAWKEWKKNWTGPWHKTAERQEVDRQLELLLALAQVSMEQLIGVVEKMCASIKITDLDDLLSVSNAIAKRVGPHLKERYGEGWEVQFATHLIASPYIPNELGIALFIGHAGSLKEAMLLDDRFPSCLLRPKEIRWRSSLSFIEQCCETIADDDYMGPLLGLVLLQIIHDFNDMTINVVVGQYLKDHIAENEVARLVFDSVVAIVKPMDEISEKMDLVREMVPD